VVAAPVPLAPAALSWEPLVSEVPLVSVSLVSLVFVESFVSASVPLPRGTVESRLHRGRAELRRKLTGY
jgi:hypothetical protein